MQISQWQAMGRFSHFRTHRVFHIDQGTGEALLLLHAYPTASWGWYELLPRLARRFRVIIPDLLGSGFSDKPDADLYSIFMLADQVEHLLAELGVQRIHIFAHAYGSTTGQELLARYLERRSQGRPGAGVEILSLSFTNAGLFPEATRPTPMQKMMLTPVGGWLTRQVPAPLGMFKRKLRPAFGTKTPPSDEMLRTIWELLRINGGHRVASRVLQYLKQRHRYRERWVGALQQSEVPMQLISGAADPVAGEGVPRVWRELLPGHRLVELDPAVGHYPPLEAPRETLAAFLDFLDAVEAAPAGSGGVEAG